MHFSAPHTLTIPLLDQSSSIRGVQLLLSCVWFPESVDILQSLGPTSLHSLVSTLFLLLPLAVACHISSVLIWLIDRSDKSDRTPGSPHPFLAKQTVIILTFSFDRYQDGITICDTNPIFIFSISWEQISCCGSVLG